MAAQVENLYFDEGDDISYTMTIYTDSSKTTPLNITNYKFYLIIKRKISDPDTSAIVNKEIIPSDPTNGIVTISIVSEDTKGELSGNYVYSIKWVDDSDKIRTVVKGLFVIEESANKTI